MSINNIPTKYIIIKKCYIKLGRLCSKLVSLYNKNTTINIKLQKKKLRVHKKNNMYYKYTGTKIKKINYNNFYRQINKNTTNVLSKMLPNKKFIN